MGYRTDSNKGTHNLTDTDNGKVITGGGGGVRENEEGKGSNRW